MTIWATPEEQAAAEAKWPRSIPDSVHVRAIALQTGLSEATSRLALAIKRGDSVGDVVTVSEATEQAPEGTT